MCADPVMMGLTALGGYMQYQSIGAQAEAQQKAYNAQAAADEQNAKIESRKQEQIADNYADKAKQLKARMRLAAGQQAAASGASGIDMSSGSSLDILSGMYENYNEDKINLLNNQRTDNYNSRVTESNFINSANANKAAAKNVASQAKAAKFGTILGTAASMYGISKDWAKTPTKQTEAFYTPKWESPYGKKKNPFDLDYDFDKRYGKFYKTSW